MCTVPRVVSNVVTSPDVCAIGVSRSLPVGATLAWSAPRTAWLRSGVREGDIRILSAELDAKLAGSAQEIFADDDQVDVLAADWSTLHDMGPFSLLFLDSGTPSAVGVDSIVDLIEPGGIVVLDDFTPCESWPPIFMGRVDTLRESWLTDERFTAVEVMIAPDASAIIATKR